MRKIIFLDIDGTLTMPVNHVPRSARDACAAARKAGCLLFLCTGRAMTEIPPVVSSIGFDGIVSSGGARIHLNGELIYTASFQKSDMEQIAAFLDGREIAFTYECPGLVVASRFFYAYYDKLARRGLKNFLLAAAQRHFWKKFGIRDLSTAGDAWRGTVCKLVYLSDDTQNEEILKEIARRFGPLCEVFSGSIPGIPGGEIGPKGVHKGAAVELLARRLGADLQDVYAFGDSDNDRTMIAAAGHGIAMGNATPSLKAIACGVTDRADRDGLAKGFKKYGLIPE